MECFFEKLYYVLECSYVRCNRPQGVLAAVSGGADSVALLFLLVKMREKEGINLFCCHVHHGLRESADKDAQYVKELCEKLSVPYIQKNVKIEGKSNIEAKAREKRYEALESVRREKSLDVIATAHHMEDQTETVLMHLMYGCGSDGLSGIKELQNFLWRPMLKIHKEDILLLLKQKEIAFCTDETNFNLDFTRNAIRKRLMPVMQTIYPKSTDSIARCAEILSAENDALNMLAKSWMQENAFSHKKINWFFRKSFNAQHIAVRRYILRNFYKNITHEELNFEQTQRLLEAIFSEQSNIKVNATGKNFIYATKKRVHIIIENFADESYDAGIITRADFTGCLGDGVFEQAFDEKALEGAVLRFRKTGDTIHPLGASGSQSLKQYMIDKKIDRPFRNVWPILAKGSEVLWVIGYGISQKAAVSDNSPGKIFLRYESLLPDGTIYNKEKNK
jgi:tRNA(Ile)-lysidine synthase